MKNYLKILFIFVLVFIGFDNVRADNAEVICSYNFIDNASEKVDIDINVYSSSSLDVDITKDNDNTLINYTENFKNQDFLDRIYTDGKINNNCPFISYCVENTTWFLDSSETAFICTSGVAATELSGEINIVDDTTEVHEIEKINYCSYNTEIITTGQDITISFFKEDDIKKIKIYSSNDKTSRTGEASSSKSSGLAFGDYIFTVRSDDMSNFFSESCNSKDLYLKFTVDNSHTDVEITTIEPVGEEDAGSSQGDKVNIDKKEDEISKFEIDEGNKITCGDTELPLGLVIFSSNIFIIIKLLVPIILIISGSITLAKAVVSSDEKVGKESTQSFIRRIIGAIILFMVFQLTQIGLSIGDGVDNKLDSCVNLLINGTDDDNSTDSSYGKYTEVIDFNQGGFWCAPSSTIDVGSIDLSEDAKFGEVTECKEFLGETFKCQKFVCSNTYSNPSNDSYTCKSYGSMTKESSDISDPEIKLGKNVRCGESGAGLYDCYSYVCEDSAIESISFTGKAEHACYATDSIDFMTSSTNDSTVVEKGTVKYCRYASAGRYDCQDFNCLK